MSACLQHVLLACVPSGGGERSEVGSGLLVGQTRRCSRQRLSAGF